MIWILFALPVLIVLVLGALLWINSPGKPAH